MRALCIVALLLVCARVSGLPPALVLDGRRDLSRRLAEALVADQETWSRKLIDFVDLPWDERCLDYYKTERQVLTSSFWQVRQPIYTSSVGRWRLYESHLAPLLEALGEAERKGGAGDAAALSEPSGVIADLAAAAE